VGGGGVFESEKKISTSIKTEQQQNYQPIKKKKNLSLDSRHAPILSAFCIDRKGDRVDAQDHSTAHWDHSTFFLMLFYFIIIEVSMHSLSST
jgi:hypothetical protein